MNGITPGKLLSELIEKAKKIGNQKNPTLTAERLLVAIIDTSGYNFLNSKEETSELNGALELLGDAFGGFGRAREALLAHINRAYEITMLEEMYIKNRLQDAEKMAKEIGYSEINTIMLVRAILATPSKTVRDIIFTKKPSETPLNDEKDEEKKG